MPLSGGTSCFKTVRIGLWGEAPLCQGAVYEFQKKEISCQARQYRAAHKHNSIGL